MTLHKSGAVKPLPTVDPGPALGANGLTYPAHAIQAANAHAAQMTAERDAALAEVARLRQSIAKAASQAAVHADHAHDHYGVHVERLCEDAQEDRHRRAASDLRALLAPADGSGS